MLSRGCECVWAPIAIPPLIISRASSQLRKRRSSAGPTQQAHKQRSLGELRSRTSDSKVQTVFRKASRQKPVRSEPDKLPDRDSTCTEHTNRTFSGGQRPSENARAAAARRGLKEAYSKCASRWTRTGYKALAPDERATYREVHIHQGCEAR